MLRYDLLVMTCWMGSIRAPTWGKSGLRRFWLKEQFQYTHTRVYWIPEWVGSKLGSAGLCPRSQVSRRQSRAVPITYKVVEAAVINFSGAQIWVVIFKVTLGKSRVGTCGRNPKLGSLLNVWTWVWVGSSHCEMPEWWCRMVVFSS